MSIIMSIFPIHVTVIWIKHFHTMVLHRGMTSLMKSKMSMILTFLSCDFSHSSSNPFNSMSLVIHGLYLIHDCIFHHVISNHHYFYFLLCRALSFSFISRHRWKTVQNEWSFLNKYIFNQFSGNIFFSGEGLVPKLPLLLVIGCCRLLVVCMWHA